MVEQHPVKVHYLGSSPRGSAILRGRVMVTQGSHKPSNVGSNPTHRNTSLKYKGSKMENASQRCTLPLWIVSQHSYSSGVNTKADLHHKCFGSTPSFQVGWVSSTLTWCSGQFTFSAMEVKEGFAAIT